MAASRGMDPLTRPYSELDVDRELWELLDLAQDDELQAVHDILYGSSPSESLSPSLFGGARWQHIKECLLPGASPLSPLLKSILKENEPAAISHRGRASIMHRIESRFRFLAVGYTCKSLLPSCCQHPCTKVQVPRCQSRASHETAWKLEIKLRFSIEVLWSLQADSGAMLRGYRPSYRETLLCIRDRLEVHCPSGLDTQVCLQVTSV